MLLRTGIELSAECLQTLPLPQREPVLAGVTVVISWPSTGATIAVTRLTLLALLVHKETFFTMLHTLSICIYKRFHF